MNSTTSTTALAIGDVLQFRSSDTLKGEITAVGSRQYVVKNKYGELFIIEKNGLKDEDGDGWHKVEPEAVTYVNVYTDGIGETEHTTHAAAYNGTKFGRTRIGIMRRVWRNGDLISAAVEPTEPRMRTNYREAHNPFA